MCGNGDCGGRRGLRRQQHDGRRQVSRRLPDRGTTPVVCGDGKQGVTSSVTTATPIRRVHDHAAGVWQRQGGDGGGLRRRRRRRTAARTTFADDCTIFMPPACGGTSRCRISVTRGSTSRTRTTRPTRTRRWASATICRTISVQITNFSFNSNNNAAWQVAKGFGSYQVGRGPEHTGTELLSQPA